MSFPALAHQRRARILKLETLQFGLTYFLLSLLDQKFSYTYIYIYIYAYVSKVAGATLGVRTYSSE